MTVSLAADLPPVEVDGAQIGLVLVNLIDNALEFSSDPVELSAERLNGHVVVRVEDRGPGLSDAELQRIFEPFEQGRAASTRHRARPGDCEGLRPGERRHARSRAERGRWLLVHPLGPFTVSGARILVVDDEPQILMALETTLRGAGYDVETAATGEDALIQASVRPPEGVILDLVLPGKSGVEVCRELREWSDAPVLVLSVIGDEQEKVAALDAGADDYVTKPFGMDELLARLRALLRRAAPAESLLEVGDLEIDLEKRAVRRNGELVQLTPHEFGLLRLFATNEGKLLTHRTILREVWGAAYQTESHYLHVYVSQLRQKIEDDPTRPDTCSRRQAPGYRFVDPKS